ncbi:non-ribosomal peptide synthetase [Paenibacillus xerothermodurans]|uniref:Non-ribosomal peptide synthetase n=1 Tax=Paenibacillus xerothermodurans TaxID=1977292 RepID=A0A2W1NS35_PAEXE|nr:non-ribosomal peptide synthetase [Paenibacillus xerothermodurans]PZE20566.1 non-ribosomal peptide synthetase [Paenibacillus xerothermodurans]
MSQKTIQKVYPLTPMQEGMMYHAVLDPQSSSYFTQLELHVTGHLDVTIVQKCIDHLLESYEILRTAFVHQQLQRPRQIVFAERQVAVHYENITQMEQSEQQRYLQAYRHQNQTNGFNLAKDPLIRVAIFQLTESSYQFMWSNHHILIDGWSLGVLMKKLFQCYETLRSGRTLAVEPVRPYGEYIKWLAKQDKEAALTYWDARLADFDQATPLPGGRRPSAGDVYRNESWTFTWDERLVAAIKQVSNRYQVTASNMFQAMWGMLLGRYNNTDDVVFGAVVSGRPSSIHGIESMVGLFINTIPVRVRMGENATFADLFAAVQKSALEAEKYDHVPLYDIQNRSVLGQQLVNHLLAFENFPLERELEDGNFEQRLGFSAEVVGGSDETNYDFNLIAFPGDQWTIKMMYNASVYDRQWIEKVAAHLTNIAWAMVSNPEAHIRGVCYLSEDERQQLLGSLHHAEVSYPQDKTIQQLFEEQVERVPDRAAVVFEDRRLTYRELNARANRLAALVRAKGVGPDGLVAIMAERSPEMIVGMLAILKAGGAYVPIDPAYPSDRIEFMLEDSGARVLLTQSHLLNSVDFSGETLCLELSDVDVTDGATYNLAPVNSPDDLCYVIYTSGTTGKPKGVMISHRNVVRLLVNDKLQFTFSSRDTWTMFHSFCFDFSVWEMYGALLYGGKLVAVPKEVAQSPQQFRQLLIDEKVTVLNQTPTAFAALIQREIAAPSRELELRYVIFGGEALQPAILREWNDKYPETKLINMYGITETTVHVTYKEIATEEINSNISNIGVPIPTLGCCIMDKDMNLVPMGVIGELCVTGLGVARGYLHRPELTAQRFIDNPYKPGERLYRSGDLARLLPNGEMEYFGRSDHQVKIRGFRIELGEIEHRLLQIPAITEAAVLPLTDHHGQPMLVAYFTGSEQLSLGELRQALSVHLPDYMVPAHFMQLPKMPLTSNGKLDRKALPKPTAGAGRDTYQAPRTELEERLAEIWQEVLGVERVGIDDDFFSLGGHSLKAMLLTSRMHQQVEREVPIKLLFERPTIRGLAESLQAATEDSAGVIEPAQVQPHYPLSFAQRRMYILSQLEGAGIGYNIPAALSLEGELDQSRLEAAFQGLIARHETLRTSFHMVDGALVQKIHEHIPFQLECTRASEKDSETLIRNFVRPFDLDQAPLLRAELIQFDEHSHLLLIDMHHSITDGASTAVLVQDLAALYGGQTVPEPKLHYKDYAVWQNQPEQQERLGRLESFWLDQFAGDIPVLDLPADYPRLSQQSAAGDRFVFGISKEFAGRIQELTTATGTTAYMFLLAAFNVFLAKCSSQEDIIVGSPIAGRTHADIRDMPGMFVNTLALRSAPEGSKTFRQYLTEVKELCLQAFAHQDYPFEMLVEKLPIDRDTSRTPLFNVMFNMQNMNTPQMRLGELSLSDYPMRPLAAKYDLTLEALESNNEIRLSFDYATARFSADTMRRWSGYLVQLVAAAVTNPDATVSEMDMLSAGERRQLLEESRATGVNYATDQCIHSQFESQAAKMPERIAAVAPDGQLTYHELEERAASLARTLSGLGIGRGDAVALLLSRSTDAIAAMLAVLKAGAAYVPIDPDNPDQRIEFILQDSRARGLITEQQYAARVGELFDGAVIDVSAARSSALESADRALSETSAQIATAADDLAYIIYTSGTTGKPKGVMIEHRQVLHLVEGLRDRVYSQHDHTTLNVALVAPFHFDASVQQIFASLLLGHTLFVVPRSSSMDGRALAAYYRSHRIDVTDGTPAHVQMLLAAGNVQGVGIRHMLIGGEALPQETVRGVYDLFASAGSAPLITNVYGPTECCVDASAFDIRPEACEGSANVNAYVPIGRPIGNNRLYIMDAGNRLQPVGLPGELCIAGDGVGRGYLNLPELTAEKFVADPFVPGELMYRTGDLARKRPDGEIEFLGRMDGQLKIRGYRIEPGEIEAALVRHEKVDKAVVVGYPEQGAAQELCAYFVAEKGELAAAAVREWLSAQLPKYMVPSYFVQVESIPLTANGKINRRALPAPVLVNTSGAAYAAPESEMQLVLCDLWQETLGADRVGVDDNFFDLGGHSLKAMMLIGSLQTKLNRDISIKVLFDRPTVRGLAAYLDEAAAGSSSVYAQIEPAPEQPYYPLSSAQNRMYILQQFEPSGASYNMPSVLLLEGELDASRLERALQALIDRHESLRTSFMDIEGKPVQQIHQRVPFELHQLACIEEEAPELIEQFIRPFNLHSAPLFRACVIKLAENRHLLLTDTHHIITDGHSNEILVKELAALYAGQALPQPKLHYKDFSTWYNEPAQQEVAERQEQYWLETFSGTIPELSLPTDYPRPSVQSFAGDVVRFRASKQLTDQIRRLALATGTTMHMVLLSVFNIFLAKLSGQDDVIVGSVVSGRAHPDSQAIPGMFVNTLALRTGPRADKTFRQLLLEVKEASLQAIEHQDYPFEQLINKLDLPRDVSRNPLFNVMLTSENADRDVLRLDRLNIAPYDMPHTTSKFDLTLGAFERADELGLQFEYCCDLFKKDTVVRWSAYLLNTLLGAVENPDARLADIELLTAEEKRKTLVEWNRTEQSDVPTDKTIHELFEHQVLVTPDQAAVVYNGRQWTYRELNARANWLARVLIAKGVRPDQPVGIMAKPSLEMAAGVLAILKAGGAFVPIDPSYPAQRISYMLSDSNARLLLTQTGLAVPQEFGGEVLLLDGEHDCSGGFNSEVPNPGVNAAADNLAYIIYTSGTTGQPKGVMIEHRSLVNLCFWHNEAFAVGSNDRSAKYAGFGFDATVWELFPYWVAGAQVHIIDETIRMDIVRLNEYFNNNGISVTFLPTQLCEQFMELDNRSLRVLLTGGDQLKRVGSEHRYTLVNNYGPTESTVVATSTSVKHGAQTITIGRPITNTRLYVLGSGGQLQPTGVAGELCIAGRGLARGYMNRPEETAERFVPDPFVPGERMYRTGDSAKWLEDGTIEYLGRIDRQVKVRGFRIEMPEIEVHLAQHAAVSAAVVSDIRDSQGNTALCAYVVPVGSLDADELKMDLASVLPDYMVPQYWVELPQLPMTPNGKVDRRALPLPQISTAEPSTYNGPANELEALLAQVWQDVLGLDKVSTTENFFALGGDSIKAIQMASRLYREGWKLEMKDLFQHPTIEQVGPYLQRAEGATAEQGMVEGDVLLTPIQRWFFAQRFTAMHHWNQSVMLHAPSGFAPYAVQEALSKIVEHHDALRMSYTFSQEGVVQHNRGSESGEVSVQVVDLQGVNDIETRITSYADEVQRSIDLGQGPLLKTVIFQTDHGDHLLIVIHHLVVDGVSWRILLEDFAGGYLQAVRGEEVSLPDKTNSFKDWAEGLQAYADSPAFLKQADYWQRIENERIMPLPKDNASTTHVIKDCASVSVELSQEDTRLLLTQVHKPYRTEMNDILLTALGMAVQEWTGESKICINLESHGREEILPGMNVSRTVGWFTAQYPILLNMPDGPLPTLIKTVKEGLRSIPDKGVGYGILRYLTAAEHKAGLEFALKPEISFNYLGQFDSEVQTDAFGPSTYGMGDQISGESEALHALNFSGIVRGGRLALSCTFNKQQYLRGTITQLMERLQRHLLQLIHHCVEKKDQDLTPSDFDATDLGMDEMEDIFEVLSEKLG